MGVLSEVPATVDAAVGDLSGAGMALAMWEAARRRDQKSGSLVMLTAEPGELVTSAASLVVHLLRRAGHHHRAAHEEVRDGSLPAHAAPFTEPWLSRECLDGPVCTCDVETACRLLAGVVEGTPAERPLAQVADQFALDRDRIVLTWTGITVAAATVLIEAAALLVAHRWGGTSDDVLAEARAGLLAAAAA